MDRLDTSELLWAGFRPDAKNATRQVEIYVKDIYKGDNNILSEFRDCYTSTANLKGQCARFGGI